MTTDRGVADSGINYRSCNIGEAQIFGGPVPLHTPVGTIHTNAPPLPPRPGYMGQQNSGFGAGYSPYSSYGGFGAGGYGNGFYNSFSGYGGGGFGGYNSYFRGMNSGYNPMDPESQFIQLAEESSRSTFQSIESFVSFIGNIATMFDSTYFALTSSFRAILGVAANFSRLRGFFAQFFTTFGIFNSIMWIYRKFLYALGLSNINPATAVFNEAFNQIQPGNSNESDTFFDNKPKGSGWPILLFLAFIMSAPYFIMKLIGSVTQSAIEESKNPKRWVNPIHAVMVYDFRGDNPGELKLKAGQLIKIAPREIQQTNGLLKTSWLLASADNKTSGLIPVNYIKRVMSHSEEPLQQIPEQNPQNEKDNILQMDPVLITDCKDEEDLRREDI